MQVLSRVPPHESCDGGMTVVAIVGSRKLSGDQRDTAIWLVDLIITSWKLKAISFGKYSPLDLKFISGGAPGVESIARRLVVQSCGAYFFEELRPTAPHWEGPGGLKECNQQIVERADYLYCIQSRDAETYDSGWTYNYAVRQLGREFARRLWV